MSNIRILPTELKNKIAAGEVVERPASVLKELVENAIDAGGSRIEVTVKSGGRALIRVRDNGSGMDTEDARLCVERHATSKLISEDDLFNIQTMGFRGEALPSIASVSRMSISTAPRGAPEGIALDMEGGVITGTRAAPASGTSVEVRDLFYNTPARKKFLKRDSTELMHIVDMLTLLALANPARGFTLTSDGTVTMDLPPASGLGERLTQVYGTEFVDGLLRAESASGPYSVLAYVSSVDNLRGRRTHQHLFINGRPVRDPSLAHAIYGAYDGIAPRDLHPVFFVFIEIPPQEVDFNVHPAKREVRLSQKDAAYRFLRHSIAEVVRGQRIDRVLQDMDKPASPEAETISSSQGAATPGHAHGQEEAPNASGGRAYGLPADTANPPPHTIHEALSLQYNAGVRHIYLGESFLAYTGRDGLTVLDHHAAHERVLYEKLLRGLSTDSHMLLFPRQVRLSHKEYLTVIKQSDMLMDLGIEVEDFGQDTVIVRSLPSELQEADLRGILSEAAAAMREGERPGQSLEERIAASIACHNSVRGSKILGTEELSALLSALDETEDPEHCPHGRPTRLFYTLADLRKAFKRA